MTHKNNSMKDIVDLSIIKPRQNDRTTQNREATKPMQLLTHVITIQRPLDPQPPKEAKHEWCYIGTLIFYDQKKNPIWKQEIPEAMILNEKSDNVFICAVKYIEEFGWQLNATITDENAKFIHPIILNKLNNKYLE
jgi:hypothetical protein